MSEEKKAGAVPSLLEVEMEVEAEGREWTRRRLEQRLQELARKDGEVFPPEPKTGDPSAVPAQAAAQRLRRR